MTIKIEHIVQNDTWEIKNVPLLKVGHKTKVNGKDFIYTEKLLSSKEFLENASKAPIVDEHPDEKAVSPNIKKYGHAHKTWYSKEDKTFYGDLIVNDAEGKDLIKNKKGFSIANYTDKDGNVFDHIAITDSPLFKGAVVSNDVFESILAKNSVDKQEKADNKSINNNNISMSDNTKGTQASEEVVHLDIGGKEHKVPPAVKEYIGSLNAKIKEEVEKGVKAVEELKKTGVEKLEKITKLHNKFIKKVPTLALNSEPATMESEIVAHANKSYTENSYQLSEEKNKLVKTFFGEKITDVDNAGRYYDLCETLAKKEDDDNDSDAESTGESFLNLKGTGIAKNSSKEKSEGILPKEYKNRLF